MWIIFSFSTYVSMSVFFWQNSWQSHISEYAAAAAAAKSLQSCPTLCDPIDGSPPGSPVPGILRARTLDWVAISFNAWKWKVKVKLLSHVQLLATPWTAAYQALLSMGFSRWECWSEVPSPSPISEYQFNRSVVSNSLWPHESQHTRLPCLSPTPGIYSNPCPSSRWCHPTISSSVVPVSSCPQFLPASGSFPLVNSLHEVAISTLKSPFKQEW